jgi:ferredoxin-type protein NapG
MPCASVCPTDALDLPGSGWTGLRIAIAAIETERCIAFRDVTCGVCARVCPVGPAALTIDARGRPVVQPGCTGCGACVTACVTHPSSIRIEPLRDVA